MPQPMQWRPLSFAQSPRLLLLMRGSNDCTLREGDPSRCGWKTTSGVGDPYITINRKNSRRKGIDVKDFKEALEDMPIRNRTTQRGLAAAVGIPQSTLFRNLQKLGLRASNSPLSVLCFDVLRTFS